MDPRQEEYESIVLEELREWLDPKKWVWGGTLERQGWFKERELNHFWRVVEIEEIKLDNSQGYFTSPELDDFRKPDHDVVVLLRDSKRPECLFGWRAPAVELDDFESDWLDDERNIRAAAEGHATVIMANLREDVLADGYGLPKDCSPDGINWF